MKNLLILLSSSLIVLGCSSIELEPGASNIIVSNKAPGKGCKYLGHITSNQGNFFTGNYTSNRNLEEGAMNDLKNQANRMGANYIELLVNRAGNTGSWNSDGGSMAQTNVTNLGNAYKCNKKALPL